MHLALSLLLALCSLASEPQPRPDSLVEQRLLHPAEYTGTRVAPFVWAKLGFFRIIRVEVALLAMHFADVDQSLVGPSSPAASMRAPCSGGTGVAVQG